MPTPERERRVPKSSGNRPTDDELLDAVVTVFDRLGYRDATMAELASTANVTKPTLYAHFGDKEALYLRSFQREAGLLTEALFTVYAASESGAVRDEIRNDILALFRFALTRPSGFRLIFTDGPRPESANRAYGELVASVNDRVAAMIRRRMLASGGRPAARQVDAMAALLVGVAIGGSRTAQVSDLDTDILGEMTVALAADGILHLDRSLLSDGGMPSVDT